MMVFIYVYSSAYVSSRSDRVSESVEGVERSYVGELAHGIGFNSDVVLLELLFDLIDACGDVLGLRADKGEDKNRHQIRLGREISGVGGCY